MANKIVSDSDGNLFELVPIETDNHSWLGAFVILTLIAVVIFYCMVPSIFKLIFGVYTFSYWSVRSSFFWKLFCLYMLLDVPLLLVAILRNKYCGYFLGLYIGFTLTVLCWTFLTSLSDFGKILLCIPIFIVLSILGILLMNLLRALVSNLLDSLLDIGEDDSFAGFVFLFLILIPCALFGLSFVW